LRGASPKQTIVDCHGEAPRNDGYEAPRNDKNEKFYQKKYRIKKMKIELKTDDLKKIAGKAISLIVLLLLGVAAYSVAKIGFTELQTFYYHILFILLWLLTAGIGMKVYNIWGLSKQAAAGDDGVLNQAERGKLLTVHAAIIVASAILVLGTIFVYFGKKSDEVFINYSAVSGVERVFERSESLDGAV
jgi:hypothetical protein